MSVITRRLHWAMCVLVAAALLAGCKATPAPSVGFADPAHMTHDPTIPFDRFWRKPAVDWKQYTRVYVADVNTAYMLQMTDWQQGERKGQIEKDVQVLRVYTHDAIVKAFREDPNHRFQVVDSPSHDPNVLVFEMAIIEVVPSKVVLNVLGYAPFFIGTGITVVRTVANDKSTVAFEARVRDAASGQVVILAADREAQQLAPIDLRGLTWYSDAEGLIDLWAKQFVEVAEQKPGEVIKGTETFRLLPW